jgi:hypothetical protein
VFNQQPKCQLQNEHGKRQKQSERKYTKKTKDGIKHQAAVAAVVVVVVVVRIAIVPELAIL